MEKILDKKAFGGRQAVYRIASRTLSCDTEFAVFYPSRPSGAVLWYLSGLTCTWQNVTEKGGFQKACETHGVTLIAPDTSPRGEHVANNEGYDLGQGAGFYVDATESPWQENYKMYSYLVDELPNIFYENKEINLDGLSSSKQGITGHSMGGHGALVLALKNPDRFSSVSAFAPIVNPSASPWGVKALTTYLGEDRRLWQEYDAVELLKRSDWNREILVDVGLADEFLQEQLKIENLEDICREKGVPLTCRRQEGYDHSYYFISSFSEEHVKWHSERLA